MQNLVDDAGNAVVQRATLPKRRSTVTAVAPAPRHRHMPLGGVFRGAVDVEGAARRPGEMGQAGRTEAGGAFDVR